MKQLTTGTSDFPRLILEGEGKYVDKTALLYELATPRTDAQYFLSRPRRFGKSLMLSTLQAMFEGRRELFRGLAIDSLPWEGWDERRRHPVYRFTMADAVGESYDGFMEELTRLVRRLFLTAGLPEPPEGGPAGQFGDFIRAAAGASPTGQIVVLIDEYDEPVAKFLDDLPALRRVRSALHDFYETLKSNSEVILFLMMTGVTKLTKLSVFSGLNHLKDLSMSPRFATLLGYTHGELDGALRENVEEFGARNGWDFATAKARLLEWYDGYRFSPQSDARVLNPVSLGKLLGKDGGELKSYWETTGGSTLIFSRLKAAGMMPADLEHVLADAMTLDVCEAETLPVESLLYQGGYLTIKDVIPAPQTKAHDEGELPETDTYVLAPPNLEIRETLRRGYISQVLRLREITFDTLVDRAKRQIRAGDLKGFLYESLFGLYASVPPDWRIRDEAEAKRYFQLFASLTGANPQPEVPSMLGYADAVIETPGAVYVLEFKFDRTADEAIRQIRERGYADKWAGGARPVTLVGINFDPNRRNIDMPVIEAL